MPSPGRALMGLRVMCLAGPEQEPSSLLMRSVVANYAALLGPLATALYPVGVNPLADSVLLGVFIVPALVMPLQTLFGSGRTIADYVANTQVVNERLYIRDDEAAPQPAA